MSSVIEALSLSICRDELETNELQFGFKPGTSCSEIVFSGKTKTSLEGHHMTDVFVLIMQLLSFYMILYRSVFVNPLTVCTTDSTDVSFQFHLHIVRSTSDLHVKFTVCFIHHNRAILVAVVRINSGMFPSWQPSLWPLLLPISRPFCPWPAEAARAVMLNRTLVQLRMSTYPTGPILVASTVSLQPTQSL